MAEYVNNVIKGEEQREIHDKRIPEVTVEDAGKVLKVADAGGYELGEAGGGDRIAICYIQSTSSTLTEEQISLLSDNKFALIVTNNGTYPYEVYTKLNDYPNYMGNNMTFSQARDSNVDLLTINKQDGSITQKRGVLAPNTSGLDGNKNYTLKYLSGGAGLRWVEDTEA